MFFLGVKELTEEQARDCVRSIVEAATIGACLVADKSGSEYVREIAERLTQLLWRTTSDKFQEDLLRHMKESIDILKKGEKTK